MDELTDDQMNARLKLWAARELGVDPADVQKLETDWGPLCDTCEYSEADITITLTDGRVFAGCETFGLFLRDIVATDVNEDGTPTKASWGPLFKLVEQR